MRLVMLSQITGRDLNEHEWSVTEFSEVLPPCFPPPHLLIGKNWGGVLLMVGSCVGTDSGT